MELNDADRADLAAWLATDDRDLDLFAGPGGWDTGMMPLGIRALGIEWEATAVQTARAFGHLRLEADIAALDPRHFARGKRVRRLIGSPPCQGFSMAGKGHGRRDAELLVQEVKSIQAAEDVDVVIADLHQHMHDDRSVLVLEPLRWALVLLPEVICVEQVPAVLPIWEAVADVLRRFGYSVETGKVSAEEYGVPQTRERAILVARDAELTDRLGPARIAPATHSYFYRRNPHRLDEGVLPWVSMAEALDWGMTERPYFTIAAGTANGGADAAMLGGSGARKSLDREILAGRWKQRSNYSAPGKPGQTAAERGLGTREMDQPSFAVTSKAFHWVPDADATVRTGNFSAKVRDPDGRRSSTGSVPFERSVDYPAPTVTGNAKAWKAGPGEWVPGAGEPADTALVQNARVNATVRTGDQPAPTITAGHDAGERRWESVIQDAKSVRVSIEEAGILQTFPADYPWQGNRGDRYRQVGDAVPPLLAFAIVKAAISLDTKELP